MIVSKYVMNIDDLDFSANDKVLRMIEGLNNEGKKILFYSIESYFAKSIPTEDDVVDYINTHYKEIVEYLTSNRCFKVGFYREVI